MAKISWVGDGDGSKKSCRPEVVGVTHQAQDLSAKVARTWAMIGVGVRSGLDGALVLGQ